MDFQKDIECQFSISNDLPGAGIECKYCSGENVSQRHEDTCLYKMKEN